MSSITIKTGTGIEYKSSDYIFSSEDMGNASISLDLSIDAQVDPEFSADWTIDHEGESFKLSTINPIGLKDTNSLRYKYSLVFDSERSDLSRFIMQDLVSSGGDNKVPQRQIFSFYATLSGFADRFNANLLYWFNDQRWEMRVNPEFEEDLSAVLVSCSNITLWSLLQSMWDTYGVRWYITEDSGTMVIFVAYDAIEVEHVFEYGIADDSGEKGLVKIERSPSNDNVVTVLQGAGSSQNKPHNYFKEAGSSFTIPDPDANELLQFVNFLGIMPISYRQYMQGWNDAESSTYTPGGTAAYEKGYTDYSSGISINPITYVKSDNISKYGEKWAGLEQSNDIYPTLKGAERSWVGRVDEVIDVEKILNDDYTSNDNTGRINAGETDVEAIQWSMLSHIGRASSTVGTRSFVIEKNNNEVVVSFNCVSRLASDPSSPEFVYGEPDGADLEVFISILDSNKQTLAVQSCQNKTQETLIFKNIPSGSVFLEIRVKPTNTTSPEEVIYTGFSTTSIRVYNYDLPEESETFSQVFDLWVKDLWNTTQAAGESDADYTERVWRPLVSTDDMTVLFDSGLLSGEEYEFKIALIDGVIQAFPDRTKSLNSVSSEWRLSLIKSDAELETVNLYLPNKTQNAVPGDFMHFINIEMPYNPYVYAAEQRVEDWMNAELAKIDDEFAVFSIQASRIFINNTFTEKSKLKAGSKIRLRDARLIGSSYVVLHVSSVVKTFTSDSINPEWDITVTDSISINSDPISLIQGEIETVANGSSSSQLQIDEMIKAMSRIFLRKDGLSDKSYSETEFKEDLKICRSIFSDDFLKGDIGGSGLGLYRDSVGNAVIEADTIIARKNLVVNQLIVNQVTHYGGKRMYSAAGQENSSVEVVSSDLYLPSYEEMLEAITALESFDANFDEYGYYMTSTEHSASEMLEFDYDLFGPYIESKDFDSDISRTFTRVSSNTVSGLIIGDIVSVYGENWFIWKIDTGVAFLCREFDNDYGSEWSSGSANYTEIGANSLDGLENSQKVYDTGNTGGAIGDSVGGSMDIYRCFFDTKNGAVLNLFDRDDLAYCQRYSPLDNAVIKYYWRKIETIGDDYIDLSSSDKDVAGLGIPSEGDNIAQVGNKTNQDRQNVMIIDQIGDPSTIQYSGINNYSFGNKDYIGYGVDISTGEAFFYTYGESYVGDRDRTAGESTYVAFEDRGSGKKLYVKGEVIIDGGLLGGTIGVVDPSTGLVVAGLSGADDVMIWAGSDTPGGGLFRVQRDGKMIAEDAEISGKISSNEADIKGGYIAGFTISGQSFINTDFDSDGSSVIMRYDPSGIFVGIGANVLPSTFAARGLGRFENKEIQTALPVPNYGVYTNVSGSSYANYAHWGEGNVVFNGLIAGYSREMVSFTAASQVKTAAFLSQDIIISFTYSSCVIFLPTRTAVKRQLGIAGDGPFSVKMRFISHKDSTQNGLVYGRTTQITGADIDDLPYRISNDGNILTGGRSIGKGGVDAWLLDFDGTEYNAYLIASNHNIS